MCICLISKAVHLELVSDLSTNGFLNIFKRFVSRRGCSSEVFSDNAANFVGANNQLSNIETLVNVDKFYDFLSQNKIKWNFIPVRSPHFGGLHESAVRLMKYYLKRFLNNVYLTYENLYTLLTQIESIINSRPLLPLSENIDDIEVLTPGHFLIGRPLLAIPEAPPENNQESLPSKYKYLKYMVNVF